jgi:hypothetical protein
VIKLSKFFYPSEGGCLTGQFAIPQSQLHAIDAAIVIDGLSDVL